MKTNLAAPHFINRFFFYLLREFQNLHFMMNYKKTFIQFLFGTLLTVQGFAQTPFPAPGSVFNDEIVSRVDIFLPQDSLDIMLAPGNQQSNYHWHATFIFDNGMEQDTINNIGFRLRGNTSRGADKKSFKISFNTYEQGRKYKGLEK